MSNNYQCICCICGETFLGHKREVQCPRCEAKFLHDVLQHIELNEKDGIAIVARALAACQKPAALLAFEERHG